MYRKKFCQLLRFILNHCYNITNFHIAEAVTAH